MATERPPLTKEEIEHIQRLASGRDTVTHYALLGIDPLASAEEIDTAYHTVVRKWHPDRFYSRDTGAFGVEIEENFVALTRAYRVLRDPLKRQAYHREARIKAPTPRAAPPEPASAAVVQTPTRVSISRTSGGTPLYELGLEAVARPSTAPVATPAAPAPEPPPAPRGTAPAAVQKLRQQFVEQFARARTYYEAGKADFDEGRYSKAEGAFYLALQFDPQNTEYAELYRQAAGKGRAGRAKALLAQAEQEESYQRLKEAIALYQRAADCDPPEGTALFRLAHLQRFEDSRSAVANYRKAIAKEPRNGAYRVALGELYLTLNMSTNAQREAQAALEIDPKNAAARALLANSRG